ncbi:Uncharacterised protein [Helicobacter canis]|uniref:Uncharacterized protein n=1 Tax=Helicobacter canis TaxID=29419 RepID=A0A377J6B0_9HELI|nr:Uncharacterised protein [Helicobacter canis]
MGLWIATTPCGSLAMTKVESACWCRFCVFLESTFSRISTQILESTFETFAAFFCHREPKSAIPLSLRADSPIPLCHREPCATLSPLSSRALRYAAPLCHREPTLLSLICHRERTLLSLICHRERTLLSLICHRERVKRAWRSTKSTSGF